MPIFAKIRRFLRNLFLLYRVDSDLDEEVRSHLGLLVEENIRAGMSLKEAERAARIELGGIEQVKEQVRELHISKWLHSFIRILPSQKKGSRQTACSLIVAKSDDWIDAGGAASRNVRRQGRHREDCHRHDEVKPRFAKNV